MKLDTNSLENLSFFDDPLCQDFIINPSIENSDDPLFKFDKPPAQIKKKIAKNQVPLNRKDWSLIDDPKERRKARNRSAAEKARKKKNELLKINIEEKEKAYQRIRELEEENKFLQNQLLKIMTSKLENLYYNIY